MGWIAPIRSWRIRTSGSPLRSDVVPRSSVTEPALVVPSRSSQPSTWRARPRRVKCSPLSRGVTVWAILTEIGRGGLRDRVTRHLDFARHLERRVLAEPRLELVAPATLSICCFRYRASDEGASNSLNERIARRLRTETRFVPSTTTVGGRYAIRPCYINPRTTIDDVNGLVEAVMLIGDAETQAAAVTSSG